MFAYCGNNPIFFVDSTGATKAAIFYDDTFSIHNGFGSGGATLANSLINSGVYDTVEVYPYSTPEEFIKQWNSMEGYYDLIVIFGHGSQKFPVLWFEKDNCFMGPGDDYQYSYSSLNPVSARELRLYTCYGSKDHSNIGLLRTADYFAKISGANVIATEGKVNFFSLYLGLLVWLDDGCPWETVSPSAAKDSHSYFPVMEVLY